MNLLSINSDKKRKNEFTDCADRLTARLHASRHQTVAGRTDQHRCGVIQGLVLTKRPRSRQPKTVHRRV